MAAQDANANGHWHDEGDDGGGDLSGFDDLDERYLKTLTTPSYDLGPQTESFVLDLTAPVAAESAAKPGAAAPPAAPARVWDPLTDPVDEAPTTATTQSDDRDEPVVRQSVAGAPANGLAAESSEVQQSPAPAPEPAPRAQPSYTIPPAPTASGGTEALTAETVLRRRRAKPQSGWRKGVYTLTGGKLNLGLSRADRRRAEQLARARTPVSGCHRLAVISLKGGVGKTTTTAALGAMFADLRGDRIIALDANPDRGTLAERAPRESGATVRQLLSVRNELTRYADVRAFTSQTATRLEVLASDSDPHVSAAFSEQDYRDTIEVLERFYNLVLTDCGTGLLHDAMRGILGLASSLVVVSSASLDGARSASATLDWLEAHGFDHLARNAVVVISSVRPSGGIVDVPQLEGHFASRCRDVVTIPYDPHLEAGGVLELDELQQTTYDAYRELSAAVGSAFAPR